MESQAQMENGIVMDAEKPLVVDINRATAEELEAVPGIGPALAERIITYRDTVRPFKELIEITTVPGISEKTYHAIADYLAVTPPVSAIETLPEDDAEEIPPQGRWPLRDYAPPLEELVPEEEIVPEAEEALPEEITEMIFLPLEEPPPEEKVAPKAEAAVLEEPSPPAPRTAPAPAGRASRRSILSWFLSALLGGLLGMIFTLMVLSGINGSLDIGHSQAVLKVENRMGSMAVEMESLRGEIDGLRQRLDALEGLTARMEQTESVVDDLHEEMAGLGQRTAALEDEAAAVSETLATIQDQAQQTETFFRRLQVMLNELFGEAEGTPTPSQ